MIKTLITTTLLLVGLNSWSPASVAAATLVVVDARGVGLRPGQSIDGKAPLVLQDGQQVTLIAPTGKMIKLRGPWDQAPEGDDAGGTADVGAALKTLVNATLSRNDRVGVVRGAGEEVIPPEPWLIDVTHVGNRCLPPNSAITFWRSGATAKVPLAIAPSDRSWLARSEWPVDADRIAIPSTIPLRDRSTYMVDVGGKETAITLVIIPEAVSNDAMRVGWMMEAGCATQAQALLKSLQ